jgi:3-isopropylmalate/(R)-2-methylmalate dehydratase large subunit
MTKPMTIAQKILAKAAVCDYVAPGEIVDIKVDMALTHEVLGPNSYAKFREMGGGQVWNPDKIAAIPDHYVPNNSIDTAKRCLALRQFVKEQGIKKYFEVGKAGIMHQVVIEKGYIKPGTVVVDTDSHTTMHGALGCFACGIGVDEMAAVFLTGKLWERVPETIKVEIQGKMPEYSMSKDIMLYLLRKIGISGAIYKTLEYTGPAIKSMMMDERLTLTNMAVEAGATNGIIEADEITFGYLKNIIAECQMSNVKSQNYISNLKTGELQSDEGADYNQVIKININDIKEPMVAAPSKPENGKIVSKVAGTKINQAFIGSCTNGRINDLEKAAKIIKGKKVDPDTKVIVIPASQKIYLEALKQGLLEIFIKAGCVVSTSTCGPCMETHMGILGPGEVMISSANRNFRGRAGDPSSQIYLASPLTVAASAIEGKIADPRKYL